MKSIKVLIALVFIAGIVFALAGQTFGYPPLLAKARKFGAKDCTFCHVDPEGGPPWNDRGKWLISEKERRVADTVDVEWLVDYKPGAEKKTDKAAPSKPASAAGSVEQELLKLEREWLDAYLNRDVAAMERIEADEFTITHANGQVLTKAQEIANLKQPGPRDTSLVFGTEDTKVRVYGDAAILTGVFFSRSNAGIQRSRYTDVYAKRNGRWQVVASHLTNLPAAAPQTPKTPPQGSAVQVDTKLLDTYVGVYELPIFVLDITREGNRLFGQPRGDTKEELTPLSETVFRVGEERVESTNGGATKNVSARVTFVKDQAGRVTGMKVDLAGQNYEGKKIK